MIRRHCSGKHCECKLHLDLHVSAEVERCLQQYCFVHGHARMAHACAGPTTACCFKPPPTRTRSVAMIRSAMMTVIITVQPIQSCVSRDDQNANG